MDTRNRARPPDPISRAHRCRCKRRSHFGIFPHLCKVFSRDAWLAELFNRLQL